MEYYDEVVEIKNRPRQQQPSANAMASSSGSRDTDGASVAAAKTLIAEQDVAPAFQKLEPKQSKATAKKMPTALTDESNEGSDTDDSTADSDLNNRQQPFPIDHKEWEQMDVSPDLKEIFQYILRYSPAKVSIDYVLQPFIPEFIPAVGDIDAFLKVVPPKVSSADQKPIADFIAKLGVDTLDEPSGHQSEPALLHMKLRSLSTTVRTGTGSGGSRLGTGASGAKIPLVSTAKSSKDIDRWIAEIQNMHVNQPFPMIVHRRKPTQDIDALMNEWPPELERTLNAMGFPNAYLDCSLEFYVRLICSFLDIVIPANDSQSDYILALYTLFNLYLAVKNPII